MPRLSSWSGPVQVPRIAVPNAERSHDFVLNQWDVSFNITTLPHRHLTFISSHLLRHDEKLVRSHWDPPGRYMEEFPSGAAFQGKNFVFDKRVAVASQNPEARVEGAGMLMGGPSVEAPSVGVDGLSVEAQVLGVEYEIPSGGMAMGKMGRALHLAHVCVPPWLCTTRGVAQVLACCDDCTTPYDTYNDDRCTSC